MKVIMKYYENKIKKFLLFAFCLMLCGCVPIFHSHMQEIDLTKFGMQNPGAKVYYDDEEQTGKVKLFRSWFDKELVIRKEGFKDYHIKLKSKWTDDAWASFFHPCLGMCDGDVYSNTAAWDLVVPLQNTTELVKHTTDSNGASLLFLPLGIVADAGLIVLSSFPLLINPWKEYESTDVHTDRYRWETSSSSSLMVGLPLEPTDELKQSCNKEGFFISNLGCTKCSYKENVVATKEESDKCSNRFYSDEEKHSYPCFWRRN